MASPRIYQVANLQTELTTTADSANNRVLRAGDTMTGELNVANNLVVTGNVGIGTTSLTAKLSVDGSVIFTNQLLVGTESAISNIEPFTTPSRQFVGDDVTTGGGAVILGKTASSALYLSRGQSGNTVSSGDLIGRLSFTGWDGADYSRFATIQGEADAGVSSGDSPGRIAFYTTPDGSSTPSERMRLNSAGNLGIGTTNPQSKLDILGGNGSTSNWGNINITSRNVINAQDRIYTALCFNDSGSGDAGAIGYAYDGSGYNMRFATVASVGGALTERMMISRLGNVGIGTTSPEFLLEVLGGVGLNTTGTGVLVTIGASGNSTDKYLRIRNSAGNFEVGTDGNGHYLYGNGNIPLRFFSNGVNRLHITGDGNVGIGTTSPSGALHIYESSTTGSIRIGGSNTTGNHRIYIQANSTVAYIDSYGNDSYNRLSIEASPLVFNAASAGDVRIGTTTAPTFGSFTNTRVSIKQIADGGSGGGLHIEANADESVAFFGFTGQKFRIGTSYRTTGSYQPIEFVTNGLSRLNIGIDGIITTPYQPSFSAYLSDTWGHPSGVALVTGAFLTQHNTGGHYSTSTRRFTAPISGVYKFDCIIATVSGSGSFLYLSAELWVNGSRVRTGGWGCGGAGGSYGETASSYVVYMNANDYAELACESNKTFTLQHGSAGHTMFSGYLIG